MKQLANAGHQHQHTHQTVYHRRNARQQTHSGLHHRLHPGRGHLGQIHRREKADGNAQQDRPRRTVNAGEDKGQDAVGRLRRRRRPFIAEQKRDQPDLPNGGNARNDQINRNQQYTGHSDQTQY